MNPDGDDRRRRRPAPRPMNTDVPLKNVAIGRHRTEPDVDVQTAVHSPAAGTVPTGARTNPRQPGVVQVSTASATARTPAMPASTTRDRTASAPTTRTGS